MPMPKWSTPERQAHLASILNRYTLDLDKWSVDIMSGEVFCSEYEAKIEPIIEYWRQDERAKQAQLWRIEQKALHGLGEHLKPIRGQFNAISQDVYHDKQPLFYVEAFSINPVTFMPFAKVKVASSYLHLFVDIGSAFTHVSKHKKRKKIRYGIGLPVETENRISQLITQAVRAYLKQ